MNCRLQNARVARIAVGRLLLTSITLAWAPAAASAQTIPARLTLPDALAIARERNPEYRQALNVLQTAAAQVRVGFGRFLPSLSVSTGWGLSRSRAVTGQDFFGKPVSLDDPIVFRSSSASQSVSAQMTLFDGFTNVNSYRAAQASAAASDAAAELTLRRVEAETARRFYDAVRAQRLIAVEERLLTAARELLDNTQRLFRAAGARRDDVLGAEAQVAQRELDLNRATGDAEKARLALKEHLGITEDVRFAVEGDVPAVFDPATLDEDRVVETAYAMNANLRGLEASATAAHRAATAAHGQRWPVLNVSGGFSRSMGLSSYDALFELNPQNRGFNFNIGLSLPLFTRFQASAQIAQAEVAARNADEQVLAGRLAVERAVRSAYIDLQNAYRAVALAEQAAELQRQRLQLTRERYALASVQFIELQQAVNDANQAERQLVETRFAYARAVVNLEEAVGAEVRQ